MTDYFMGEVKMFAGTYAPEDFMLCNGAAISVSQYQALYSLIGTAFGGDGITNFNIPDLRSRVPVGQGTGAGLTPRAMAQTGGTESVGLAVSQIPAHSHTQMAATSNANSESPAGGYLGTMTGGSSQFGPAVTANLRAMSSTVVGYAGSNNPHNNVMPSLPISFMICTQGLYPTRPN